MSDDPRAIETGIEATRTRLADTMDRIRDKLTLTGLVDEVMGQAGVPRYQNGPDVVMGLLRRHPVPVMLAAAGVGFLVYRRNRSRSVGPAVHDAEFVEVPLSRDRVRLYDPEGGTVTSSTAALEDRRGYGP